ncbi:Retron-type reverse transcriptase [Salinivirga cyanobacteriivorans]|uniref:Retron-type reverse transcriptase n=1 Tax=Salinivirga cyanobacteriivorans TaxID=1307839 RepID=A0A0S2I310_9BACT|nr:reverse transcriptase/maturase family protein [Salinivirga cyanobacteriivorans]ALO16602.1 Retron-type reverse transcriptase [Salinivirga cyanobacteriivorans]
MFRAYFDARKNKRNTINQLVFEKCLESNIFELVNEVLKYQYIPKSSICFIVNNPVKREIFAADFRDRVIHHFIYNYISPVFEKTFINDSYSCRLGKGTHYGIKRIDHFIRSCSQNYTKDCYILKLDIRGYFMAMNKKLLFQKAKQELIKQKNKLSFDLPLVLYLIEKTIFNDPTKNCIVKGQKSNWQHLPTDKSLFHAKRNCGLPIGNLTSQLFGNVYLNEFDHWVKKELGIKYYGRYVDDFVLIHENKGYLKFLIPILSNFLHSTLKLDLHPRKIYLQHYTKGVKYLGAMIKPHRIYLGNRTKGNFYNTLQQYNQIIARRTPDKDDIQAFQSSMNSYLGIAKHYKTRKIRKKLIFQHMDNRCWQYVYLLNYDKFVIKPKSRNAVNYVG